MRLNIDVTDIPFISSDQTGIISFTDDNIEYKSIPTKSSFKEEGFVLDDLGIAVDLNFLRTAAGITVK